MSSTASPAVTVEAQSLRDRLTSPVRQHPRIVGGVVAMGLYVGIALTEGTAISPLVMPILVFTFAMVVAVVLHDRWSEGETRGHRSDLDAAYRQGVLDTQEKVRDEVARIVADVDSRRAA